MPQTAETIWRNFVTNNVPSSGVNNPDKVEIRKWGTWVETIFTAVITSGGKLYASKAAMDADTAPAMNTPAIVLGDATAANNGLYRKSAAAGLAGWTRAGDVPGYSFITATNAGAGTANAIQATTSIPIPSADGGALVALPIVADNTASPVSVSFNGGAALTVKTNSGNDVVAGGLTAGMIVAGYVSGSTFRLLSDQSGAAVLAGAEAVLNEMIEKSVGSFASDGEADSYLTGLGLTKQAGTIYFNMTSGAWKYWDGDSWETFPYAAPADGSVTEVKLADDSVSVDKIKSADASAIREKIGADRDAINSLRPFTFDMHFGPLRGFGWADGDVGGAVDYVLASPASAGARSITLTAGSATPVSAQLLAFQGTDGEWYSIVAGSAAGTLVNFDSDLPVDVAAGATFHNFYINESHPNEYGYRAIADALIRERLGAWTQVYKAVPEVYGTSTIADLSSASVANPGSQTVDGWTVTPTAAASGCQWSNWRPRKTGRYRAMLKCNKGAGADLFFRALGSASAIYQVVIDTTDVSVHYLDFTAHDLEPIDFVLFRDSTAFFVSDLVILEREPQQFDGFETGEHIVFGDSWAAISTDIGEGVGIIDRLRERFPLATFTNKGVGGNTAAMLVARYDTDIRAYVADNPVKSMLVITGTNDYFGGVAPATVAGNLGVIASRALVDGIVPIIFTPSVGSPSSAVASGVGDGADRFDLSRRYTDEIAYYDQEGTEVDFLPTALGTSALGTATYTIQKGWARVDGRWVDFVINLGWTAHTGAGNMKIGNLPWKAAANTPVTLVVGGLTYTSYVQGYVEGGNNQIFLGQAASGSGISALPLDTAVTALYASGRYLIG